MSNNCLINLDYSRTSSKVSIVSKQTIKKKNNKDIWINQNRNPYYISNFLRSLRIISLLSPIPRTNGKFPDCVYIGRDYGGEIMGLDLRENFWSLDK